MHYNIKDKMDAFLRPVTNIFFNISTSLNTFQTQKDYQNMFRYIEIVKTLFKLW